MKKTFLEYDKPLLTVMVQADNPKRIKELMNKSTPEGAEGDEYGMEYPTSKAGLMYGLTKSIAQYGSKYNVRCVCISPGPVLTRPNMSEMKTLLGRAADPQEIVDLCLFVSSDKGQFINGENIMIDGGRNAMGRRND